MIGRVVVLIVGILSTACMAASSEWRAYIRLVEQANISALQTLPQKINDIGDSLNDEQTQELTTAISMALIEDPVAVINATSPLDKSPDPLKQRFGASFICCIPGMTKWTDPQIEAYFARAEPALKMAGPAAAKCLGTMRDVIDEVRYEMAQSPGR